MSGAEGTTESALFSNHIKEAFEAKVAFQKNVLSGVMGQNFDTSSLTKEGIESLNIMQAAVPGAQQLFSAAEDALKTNNVFSAVPDDVEIDNVTMQVFTDESGRTNFDYRDSDGETIELRTEDGIFTEEFYDDERITGKFARAAATQELQNLRFDTADTAASSVAQSFDFMLSGLSKLDENGEETKVESANTMNLGASLSAFANDIPNAFGSAIDGKFLSLLSINLILPTLILPIFPWYFRLNLENKVWSIEDR